MRDTDLVNALRACSRTNCGECPQNGKYRRLDIRCITDLNRQAADRIANQNAHVAALQKEIEKLRGQNKQLREAAALVAKESAELLEQRWIPVTERLPELQSWGASEVVLGLIKSENAPSLNKLHNLTLCVYCDNGIWSMPGRYVAITHWMPLPKAPEAEKALEAMKDG